MSYTVALAKVQLTKAQINMMKSGRKRKRPSSDDVVSGRSQAERALHQLQLCYNCQRLSRELGKDHPETAETMISIAWAYYCLATTRKDELIPTKVLKQYSQSAEIYYKEALEVERKSLGDDHPLTLGTLHEVAHFDLINKRMAEGIQKLEETLEKQKYVLGINDPDTQATIISLRRSYRLCGETKKLKDLSSQVGNGSRRVKGRRLMINELENGSDTEVDNQRSGSTLKSNFTIISKVVDDRLDSGNHRLNKCFVRRTRACSFYFERCIYYCILFMYDLICTYVVTE